MPSMQEFINQEVAKREAYGPTLVNSSNVGPANLDSGAAVRAITVDFNTLQNGTGGTDGTLTYPVSGGKLIYLRNGSSPNGRLLVSSGGGKFFPISPGSTVEANFSSLTVKKDPIVGVVTYGQAQLLILPPGATYVEHAYAKPAFAAVDLLGLLVNTASPRVFAGTAVTQGIAPDATHTQGQHTISGWSRIRVYMDFTATAGATIATTFTLIPWLVYFYSGAAQYWECSNGAVSYAPGPNWNKKAIINLELAQVFQRYSIDGTGEATPVLAYEIRDDGSPTTMSVGATVSMVVQGIE